MEDGFLISIRHITLAIYTVRIMPTRWFQQKIGLKYQLRRINETLTSAQYDIRSDREWLATAFIVPNNKGEPWRF